MVIEDLHPLRQKANWKHIIKIQGCIDFIRKYRCACCSKKNKKPDFRKNLKYTFLKEMKIPIPKANKRADADPFYLLGYGVNAYMDIIASLMRMMCFITVLVIPLLYAYSHNASQSLKDLKFYKYAT